MFTSDDEYLIKVIRADEADFFREFVFQCTRTPKQRQKFPLRIGDKKTYTVTGAGVYQRSEKLSQYSANEKMFFSKANSTSLVTPTIVTPPFGHNKDRKEKLVGMMFSLSNVLLTKRLFIYDGGTVNRGYDYDTKKEAERYYAEKVHGDAPILFAELELFKHALLKAENKKKFNEVLARVRWNIAGGSGLFIATENLESRLLAQDRARILRHRLEIQAQELGVVLDPSYSVPILFYAPGQPAHLTMYDDLAQSRDRAEINAIFKEELGRKTLEEQDSYEFLLFIDDLRAQYTDANWTVLIANLEKTKQSAIAWSLLEKNPELYRDPFSEDLVRLALISAITYHGSTETLNIINKKPDIIQSASLFNSMLKSTLEPIHRTAIFDILKDTLPTLIKSSDDFIQVLAYLNPEQCTAVSNALKDTLSTVITSGYDFVQVLKSLNPEQHTAVFGALKDKFAVFITSAADFKQVLAYLSVLTQFDGQFFTINDGCYISKNTQHPC